MFLKELIAEARYLSKSELLQVRDINRVEVFLQKVAAGAKSPFTTLDGKRFDADPAQLADVQKILTDPEDKTRIPTLRSIQGEVIKFSDLAKTKEFGGQQKAWDEEATGKESFVIKPSQLWPGEGGTFAAKDLYSVIVNHPELNSSEIGKQIIDIANQIQAGQVPNWKAIDPQFQPAIRDYAGEYLGVLALIRGTANFPNRKEFIQHLGAGLDKINYFFPPNPAFPLGDSLAGTEIDGAFVNQKKGTFIFISSKGGKIGAPPSIMGLEIPDNLRTAEFAREIEFIDTLQNEDGANQTFAPMVGAPKTHGLTQGMLGMNKLFELGQQYIPQEIKVGLPFSNDDIATVVKLQKGPKQNEVRMDDLPENVQKILSNVDQSRFGKGKSKPPKLSGIFLYTIQSNIVNIVNSSDIFPNFEALAREILQHNFIQIFARPRGAELKFDVLWPNRQMATGKVKLYYKGSAGDPGGQRLSFSVS